MAKKILVVDKDPSVHSFVEKNLPKDKFILAGINDGLSALDLLDKVKPDIILVEHGLDGIDIFRFLEKVTQKNRDKECLIVLTVDPGDPYDPARLLAMGVIAILKKPLDPQQLLEKLQELSEETATLIDKKAGKTASPPPSASLPATGSNIPGKAAQGGSQGGSKDSSEKTPEKPPMKIEEMLGWSLPGEKFEDSMTQKSSPATEANPDLEQTVVVPLQGGTSLPQKDTPAEPPVDLEQTMVVSSTPATSQPPLAPASPGNAADLEQTMVVAPAPPEVSVSSNPAKGPLKAPLNEAQVADLVRTAAREVMEKVVWEILPGVAEIQMKSFTPPVSVLPHAETPAVGADPSDQADSSPPVPAPAVLSSKEADALVRSMAKDIIEKVAWDVVPEMAGKALMGSPGGVPSPLPLGTGGSAGAEEARQLVGGLAKDVIEQVAWEVVPALAEEIVKKELEKVKPRS